MTQTLLVIFLALMAPLTHAAPQSSVSVRSEPQTLPEATSRLSGPNYQSPSIRACTAYVDQAVIKSIARYEAHSRDCPVELRPAQKWPFPATPEVQTHDMSEIPFDYQRAETE